MLSDIASKFTSRIVNANKTLYFCDIGDLLTFINGNKPPTERIEVRDYNTGEWIDGQTAFYVHADKKLISPMGWGIASFKDRKTAAQFGSVMNFSAALKAVR